MIRGWARAVVIAGVSCPVILSGAMAGGKLEIMYHERAPYYVSKDDGTVGGIIGDRTMQVLKKAQIFHNFRRVSANRQLRKIKQNRIETCALGWFKKPEREIFGKFSSAIYRDKPMVILVRRAEPKTRNITSLTELSDDPEARMGAKLGYSYGPVIDKMMKSPKFNVVVASQDNAGMARMLIGKRFDYFFAAAEEAPDILKQGNVSNDSMQIRPLSDSPPGNSRYIICSKRVEDALINRLNMAIEEIQE